MMGEREPDSDRRVLAWDGQEWAVWRYHKQDTDCEPAEWSREMSDESHDKPQPTRWMELPSRSGDRDEPEPSRYTCSQCRVTCASMGPCLACGSMRVVLTSVLMGATEESGPESFEERRARVKGEISEAKGAMHSGKPEGEYPLAHAAPRIGECRVETIERVSVSGKWMEFWWRDKEPAEGGSYHDSSKQYPFWEAYGAVYPNDAVLNDGLRGVIVEWRRNEHFWEISRVLGRAPEPQPRVGAPALSRATPQCTCFHLPAGSPHAEGCPGKPGPTETPE